MLKRASVTAIVVMSFVATAWGESPTPQKPEDAAANSAAPEAAKLSDDSTSCDTPKEDEPYQRQWILSIGGSNYYPQLKESEAQIDAALNDTLGRIVPGWRRPQSFKAWRDGALLWDMCIGAGRDISPKFTWMVWTGVAAATIKNKRGYGPLGTDIRFSRITTFLTLEGYYYPFGKPVVNRTGDESALRKIADSFTHAKPYMAFATGYSFVRAGANAKFKLCNARIFRKVQVEDHHLAQISPRIGVEIPLGRHSSISAEGVYYYFFPKHTDEYSGLSLSCGYRYRF